MVFKVYWCGKTTARSGSFQIFIASLLLSLAFGCATSTPRIRYTQELQPAQLTNVVAYRTGTNLEIRIPYPGKDAYAHASWPHLQSSDPNFDRQFAVLTFDKEEPAAHKSTIVKTNRLPVRTFQQWRQLVQNIFAGLVPAQAGHGVLFLVQNEEVVVFRDSTGKITTVKLENKPPEIVVDHTYDDADFSRQAMRLLRTSVGSLAPNQNQLLFITGGDPAFVFMDLQQPLIVFLSYPQDPETQALPGVFTVRALNSLLFRSLVITAVKNPFTLVSRGLWHIGVSGAAVIASGPANPSAPPPPLSTAPGMDLAEWEKHLDGLVSARRYRGRLDLFIDGEQFFPALIESVEAATRSVDVQVFIFDTDDYALKIASLLKERSAAVKVRVLTDDAGSLFASAMPKSSASPLNFPRPEGIVHFLTADSKVRARASANPWLTMDHRKCFIIDDRLAYLGGMNIGREYRYTWHDMMAGLTGPVVGRLAKDYDEAWDHAGPLGDFAYAWDSIFKRAPLHRNAPTNSIDIRPLRTATGKTQIYHAQLDAINHARSYIYIENAYFNDDVILRALVNARRRGVDVRVIFPQENDSDIMQTTDQVVGNELIANGARVYVYPGMTHVKAAIYDGWACLGSANFSKMSLHVGQELDVAFSDPATVARLKHDLFETDFRRSHELTTPAPLNWFDPFIKAFGNQL